MKSVKYIFVFLLICGLTHGEEVKIEENEEEALVAEARSDNGNENSISLSQEKSGPGGGLQSTTDVQVRSAIIAPQHPTYQPHVVAANSQYHHPMGIISPVYQHPNPVYQPELGLSVTSYQQQHPGIPSLLGAPHLKPNVNEKKATSPVKDLKPDYYPKVSSYATIPEQPQESINTPRFVADPNRNQMIEEISAADLQALTMRQQAVLPQQFPLVHQPVQMPGYNFNYLHGAPGVHAAQFMNPYPVQQETSTIKYKQTEHGFMDRMWGEVMTMRQTITNDFFGAIPAFFRNIWDTIVGAVSSTSARMLGSFDWLEAFQFVARQLS